jgi:SAM-dependent methyltransferase
VRLGGRPNCAAALRGQGGMPRLAGKVIVERMLMNRTRRTSDGQLVEIGQAGRRVYIADDWQVLDVGSGHRPSLRANVLLERYLDDNDERSGAEAIRDVRLVVGDAQAMPFATGEFDYAIASHVAEHVDDPRAFCTELSRVARRGYIETPGWLGDVLLREPFHRWRVRRVGGGLRFDRVINPRPLGLWADAFYALVYFGLPRVGHRTWVARRLPMRGLARIVRMLVGQMLLAPGMRGFFYMEFEWADSIDVEVR